MNEARPVIARDPSAGRFSRPDSNIRGALILLRRRGWIIILCAIVSGAAAAVLSSRQQPKYTASAGLFFQDSQVSQQLFGYGTATPEQPTTITATRQVLLSQPVLSTLTAKQLGAPYTSSEIGSSIAVSQVSGSDVMAVSATADSPNAAATIANTYAQVFITYQQHTSQAQVLLAVSKLEAQIARLRTEPEGNGQIPNLETRLNQLNVLAATQTGNVQLAGRATVPDTQSSPKTKRTVAIAVVAGLLLGVAAVFILEQLDQSIRDTEEASQLLRLPVLTSIPLARASSSARSATVSAEAFSLLRTQLHYFNIDRTIKSIAVTSPAPGDGKSTVAWNLALAAAALSKDSSILVIDCDLRRPTISDLAGLGSVHGLSDVLTQAVALDDAIQDVPVRWPPGGDSREVRLNVLTAGTPAPNPEELMQSRALLNLLEFARDEYDLIVIDTPPPTLVSDALPVLTAADGVLTVVRAHKTRRDAVVGLREQLASMPTSVLGVVMNAVPRRESAYGPYEGYSQTSPPSASKNADDRDVLA
jgi:capsular exopolysaccharide synthesis family protein